MPPDIEFSYPADNQVYPGYNKWRFEKELVSARKEGESRDLCHLSSEVVLKNLETKKKVPGRISGIYCYRLVGYYGKPYQKTSFWFKIKTDGEEEVLYPMWQRPKNLILWNAETGRNFHFRA